jgi:hypothetical protein
MHNYPVFAKKWHLNLWRGKGLIVLAAPLIGKKSLFTEALEKIYKNKRKIIFSQFVDENQWNIGNRSEFLNRIAARHSVNLAVTANFYERNAPKIGDHVYVFHGLSSPKLEFLNDVLHYGMTDLPNIVYEYSGNTTDWLSEAVNWNKQFLSWYQLEAPDESMVNLINQIGLICWTSDYFLSFGIADINQLIVILDVVQKIADDKRLSLIVNTERLRGPLK